MADPIHFWRVRDQRDGLTTQRGSKKWTGVGPGNAEEAGPTLSIFGRVRVRNLPGRQMALQFTRDQLDRLGLGQELTFILWNKQHYHLPPSDLPQRE